MCLVPNVKLNVFVHAEEFIVYLLCSDMVSGVNPFLHGLYGFVSISRCYSLLLICIFAGLGLGVKSLLQAGLGFCFFLD